LYRQYQANLDDSDDDEGPDNDDAWLFEDLSVLLKLMVKKKEKEGFLALIFEGTTAELLKDIITIFYSPLAQVYKAASIADSLGDLQSFINDLIKTVEAVEERECVVEATWRELQLMLRHPLQSAARTQVALYKPSSTSFNATSSHSTPSFTRSTQRDKAFSIPLWVGSSCS
jgi:hypothetical protein